MPCSVNNANSSKLNESCTTSYHCPYLLALLLVCGAFLRAVLSVLALLVLFLLCFFRALLLLRSSLFLVPLFSHPSFLALPSRWPCLGRSCPQASSSSPPHRRPLPRVVGPLCPPHGTGPFPFPSLGGLAFPCAGIGSMPRPPWWASWGRRRWLPALGGFECVRWFGVGLGCFGVGLEVAGLGAKAFLGHEVVEEIV